MAFSPDGKSLVTAGPNDSLRVWDTRFWQVEQSLNSRRARLLFFPEENDGRSKALSVAFSPDGAQILSSHEDGTNRLWDKETGRLIRTIESIREKSSSLRLHS